MSYLTVIFQINYSKFIFAHRVEASRRFCAGLTISNRDLNIANNKKNVCELRTKLLNHLLGIAVGGGDAHVEAITNENEEEKKLSMNQEALFNIVKTGLETVKSASAARQHESSIAGQAASGTNVGTLNHSRQYQLITF